MRQGTIGEQGLLRFQQNDAEECKDIWTGIALSHLGYDFAWTPVRLSKAGALQTKLVINKPGDEFEQEGVVQQVMRNPRS